MHPGPAPLTGGRDSPGVYAVRELRHGAGRLARYLGWAAALVIAAVAALLFFVAVIRG